MLNRFLYIVKFFFCNESGVFRKTLLFPFFGITIGSYIVFITLSIMNGIESQVFDRIKAFNYQYSVYSKDNNKQYNIANRGYEKTCLISKDSKNKIITVKSFDNIDIFVKNKLNDYLINDNDYNEIVLIGSQLAHDLNVNIGDTLVLSSPVDISIITKRIPSKEIIISGIFNLDLFDYDSRYLMTSCDFIADTVKPNIMNDFLFNENVDIVNGPVYKNNDNNLIKALELEKDIYLGIGLFIIMVSSILLFNITILSLLEKQNQLKILDILSVNKKTIFIILIIQNIFLNSFLVFMSLVLSELTIILNYNYNLLNFIFGSLPFNILPNNFLYTDYSMIGVLLIFITSLFGSLPLFFIKYNGTINAEY